MNILALDSSSPVASVAFVTFDTEGGAAPEIRFRSDKPHARSDSSALFEGLQSATSACGLPGILCVGLGPGSYNGLRAGIAAARAMATAIGIPLVALASPLALPGPASGFWAVGDARGGHYWIAGIREGSFFEQPRLIPPAEIIPHLQEHPGFPVLASSHLSEVEVLRISTPDAGRLAILAKRADPIAGTPEPLYLKPPHITLPRPLSAGI